MNEKRNRSFRCKCQKLHSDERKQSSPIFTFAYEIFWEIAADVVVSAYNSKLKVIRNRTSNAHQTNELVEITLWTLTWIAWWWNTRALYTSCNLIKNTFLDESSRDFTLTLSKSLRLQSNWSDHSFEKKTVWLGSELTVCNSTAWNARVHRQS